MKDDPGVFETMHTMRAMRRLKKDPVSKEIIEKIIDAGIRAPSGQNKQAWAFVVLTDEHEKKFFGDRYHHWLVERFGSMMKKDDPTTKDGRSINAARHLAEHMHEAPVILMVFGKRDWPFNVEQEKRVGLAPPSYGSVYPCVQNILLACRAVGLGASLTTMHQMFEDEIHEEYAIPREYGIVATIPIGWPEGNFGPVARTSAKDKTHFNRWGNLSL